MSLDSNHYQPHQRLMTGVTNTKKTLFRSDTKIIYIIKLRNRLTENEQKT